MVPSIQVTVLLSSFVGSLLLLILTMRLAPRWNLLARANARSSHQSPTPSVGGVAIVLPVLIAVLVAAWSGDRVMLGLFLAGGWLAIVGFLDDLRELSPLLRFGCQTGAVFVLLSALSLETSWLAIGLIGFLLLWHVNLFNFMDGIDGIAATQTLIFCLGTQILADGIGGNAGIVSWAVIGAGLGFLAFNWPPARIFMGDTGSLFLGLVLGGLIIEFHRSDELPFIASIILLSGFWFDASYTLCVRMITGQRFTEAHRSHIYQRFTDQAGHLKTTALFAALGCFWLLPLAWLAVRYPDWAYPLAVLAVLPYLVAAVMLKAGRLLPEKI